MTVLIYSLQFLRYVKCTKSTHFAENNFVAQTTLNIIFYFSLQ